MDTNPAREFPLFSTLPASIARWLPVAAILLTSFLFDGLFWQRSIGLNLTLFTCWTAVFVIARYGWKATSVPARIALLGVLISAIMIYVHHSVIAIVATLFSLLVFLAFAHEYQLRSVLYAVPQAFFAFAMAPLAAWEGFDELRSGEKKGRGLAWFKVALIPALIAILFFQLYRAGNPKFDDLTAGLTQAIYDLFEELFTPHIFFIILGLFVSAVVVRRLAPRALFVSEQKWTDSLLRLKKVRPHWLAPVGMNPLERERRGGLVLLVLVNAMLLVVNVIDINWVWSGFTVPEGFSLKQFVHNGTWMLIISMLLSIVILMHLFRGNLNFYARSTVLKWLAIAWVVQNFVLGISVFLRNYHYISFHGLAYKRIGVIVFLALVLFGLITLLIKIKERKSFFYVARMNTWALFVAIVGLSTVDWDRFIVKHNLEHANLGEIDIDNYLHMSDKVLPLVYANLDVVERQMAQHRKNEVRWVEHLDPLEFRTELDAKKNAFVQRHAHQYWQERNLADDRTMAQLLAVDQSMNKE